MHIIVRRQTPDARTRLHLTGTADHGSPPVPPTTPKGSSRSSNCATGAAPSSRTASATPTPPAGSAQDRIRLQIGALAIDTRPGRRPLPSLEPLTVAEKLCGNVLRPAPSPPRGAGLAEHALALHPHRHLTAPLPGIPDPGCTAATAPCQTAGGEVPGGTEPRRQRLGQPKPTPAFGIATKRSSADRFLAQGPARGRRGVPAPHSRQCAWSAAR